MKDGPIAVFGLARSGLSVLKAFSGKREIYAWDDDEEKRRNALKMKAHIQPLTIDVLKQCGCLVLSPGVPLHYPKPHPVVEAARQAGIEIICDIELFHRTYPDTKTIGVTGTNGKSTTTALITHILNSCGKKAVMGGNIGVPVFDSGAWADHILVLELSSYQLDLCPTFTPDIAILLNITPDHLDRHGSMKEYIGSKSRILRGSGIKIIGVDDEASRSLHETGMYEISVKQNVAKGVYAQNGVLFDAMEGAAVQVGAINAISCLKGLHNHQNIIAAYAAARCQGIDGDSILRAVKTFPGLAHRQYPIKTIKGVTYINDSKATNAEAASKALASHADIFWILGGCAKETGLQGLESCTQQIRHAFLIGEAMESFSAWMLANHVSFHLSETLDIAVNEARIMAEEYFRKTGQVATVLLSPACASWDQYSSFEERGDHFTTLVNHIDQEIIL